MGNGQDRLELADGAWMEIHGGWLDPEEARRVMAVLEREVPWAQHAIQLFGKEVQEPRLSAWMGDPGAVYTYSGVRHEPLPWTSTVAALRERVSAAAGTPFNSVLCNLYRDGRDAMGMHADREPELGPEPLIASLSLGATRRFTIRHRRRRREGLDVRLEDGMLLMMGGALQSCYRHGVPRDPRCDAPRINLTFRRIVEDALGGARRGSQRK